MCNNCKNIKVEKSFSLPDKYLSILDKLMDENGYWVDDLITHEIKCKKCGTVFVCACDTYHGNGSFGKER